jgi:hypothetical protein
MKRQYDWSSIVTKIEIIDGAKPEPANFTFQQPARWLSLGGSL